MNNWQEFNQEINQPDQEINLAKAALLIAQNEYPNLNIDDYLSIFEQMSKEVNVYLPSSSYPLKIIQGINHYLFEYLKFRGNTQNYYDPRNSFLNEVINRKLGIPITLSLIYLEVAKRINFPMFPISMPGHFLLKPDFENAGIFVDPFNQGEILFPQDCEEKLSYLYQQPIKIQPHFLAPVGNKQVLNRLLNNLKLVYLNQQQLERALKIITGLLMLDPFNQGELRDRGIVYFQLGDIPKACYDLECYINLAPNAQDLPAIQQLLDKIKSF